MSECSCWIKYPNENHKRKNGKWKCVDNYECVRDLQTIETKSGFPLTIKTKCIKKES